MDSETGQIITWFITGLLTLVVSIFIYEIKHLRKSVESLNHHVTILLTDFRWIKKQVDEHDERIKDLEQE